jgi:hypothetical protein
MKRANVPKPVTILRIFIIVTSTILRVEPDYQVSPDFTAVAVAASLSPSVKSQS